MSKYYVSDRIKAFVAQAKEHGESETSLILRAAAALYEKTEKLLWNVPDARVLILCGPGGNGADGLALSSLLTENGIANDAYLCACGRRTEENIALGKGVLTLDEVPAPERYSLIVDAIYGVGMHGELPDEVRRLTNAVNNSGVPVLSVDVPTGVNASTAEADEGAIRAAYTLCMVEYSLGTAVYPGAGYCGKTELARLTADRGDSAKNGCAALSSDEIPFNAIRALQRYPRAHKGTYGTVAVIAGGRNMAGASYLSAKAAYLCGAGLVKIIAPECNRVILQTLLPEAVLYTYEESTPEREILAQLKNCTSVVLGPGLGRSEKAERIVSAVLENSSLPLVLDADGLNLAAGGELIGGYKGQLVLTPHFKEASRLSGIPVNEISACPLKCAGALTERYGHTVLLKDAHTIVSDGRSTYINLSGCDGMATGGSGDVLSGVVGALIRGADTVEETTRCAAYAAYLHGLAGESAAKKHGTHALLASRIADELCEILKEKNPE